MFRFNFRKKPAKIKKLKIKKVKMKGQKSLKNKLLSRVILISVAICIVFGGTGLFLIYRNSEQFMKDEVNTSAAAYEQVAQNLLNKYITSVTDIANDTSIFNADLSRQEIQDRLNQTKLTHGFLSVSAADSSGTTLEGDDISKQDYFQQAIAGRFYLSSTYLSEKDSGIVVTMSTPIDTDQFTGVLACSISTGTLNGMISGVSIGDSGYGFIVDANGKTIADKNLGNVLDFVNYLDLAKKDPSYSGIAGAVTHMAAGETSGEQTQVGGRKAYISYLPVSGTDGWSIGVVAFEDEMMSGMYTAIYIMLGLIVGFILLAILLARGIAMPIVRPVLALSGRIEKLAEGDLHSEVPAVKTKDEIQSLSEAFDVSVKSLNGYISEISSVLNGMAHGDFTVKALQDYRGDFSAIRDALDTILSSMNSIFRDISRMAEQVAGGSQQVASGSQVMAQGATEQAGTVEQLAASLREVTRKVDESAQYADHANELAADAMGRVNHGSENMQRMVGAMAKIDESSGKIEKIIKTIEDLAFQTNILALNAAVEAARAGEAGKGFSVVADEVRNLAGKSSEAAKNTSQLIRESLVSVREGSKIADETEASLKEIVEKVGSMTDLFESISKSAKEQAEAIGQINQGSEQISAVVQSNSATAEQSAATSEELSRLAQELRDMLGRFQLEEDDSSFPAVEERAG